MKTYSVGGCVRDLVMGVSPKDRDYVVVGATESEMIALGYERVGKDFPVFLHPETRDEYALARTERKTGSGYGGFSVDVVGISLEDDLFRRDLTINAMAMDEFGEIIDPYGGRSDIEDRILRHVSEHFSEDPVRILRIARFSARYGFSIAEETMDMMRSMVEDGEFDSLTEERVWKEFEKALQEPFFDKFIRSLSDVGALQKLPGFCNFEAPSEVYAEISENIYYRASANFLHSFAHMDRKSISQWKMPTDLVKKAAAFGKWKSLLPYSGLEPSKRVAFARETKSLHDEREACEFLFASSFPSSLGISFENELNEFSLDLAKLKQIDYQSVIADASSSRTNPKDAVEEAQRKAISPSTARIKPSI